MLFIRRYQCFLSQQLFFFILALSTTLTISNALENNGSALNSTSPTLNRRIFRSPLCTDDDWEPIRRTLSQILRVSRLAYLGALEHREARHDFTQRAFEWHFNTGESDISELGARRRPVRLRFDALISEIHQIREEVGRGRLANVVIVCEHVTDRERHCEEDYVFVNHLRPDMILLVTISRI